MGTYRHRLSMAQSDRPPGFLASANPRLCRENAVSKKFEMQGDVPCFAARYEVKTMKTLRKIFSLLLAFCLCLSSCAVSAWAITPQYSLTVSPDPAEIAPGDEVSVALSVGNGAYRSARVELAYDADVFSVKSDTSDDYVITPGAGFTFYTAPTVATDTDGKETGTVTLIAISTASATVAAGRPFASLTFTSATDAAEGTYPFTVTTASIGPNDPYDNAVDVADLTGSVEIKSASLPVTTYTVTYNANGGVGSMPSQTGTSVTIATNGFTRDLYSFNGWNTSADGTGDSYTPGVEYTLSGDLVLYAQWTQYTVEFVDEDGTSITDDAITSGSEVPTKASDNGHSYVFAGWTESVSGTTVTKKAQYYDVSLTRSSNSTGLKYRYDGAAHKPGLVVKLGTDELVRDTDYTADFPADVTNAGEKTVMITFVNGGQTTTATYQIIKRAVTLTSASATKTYDGTELTNGNVTVGGFGFVGSDGATYDVTGTQTEVGSSNNTFAYTLKAGTNADNYTITVVAGRLKVTSANENRDWNQSTSQGGTVTTETQDENGNVTAKTVVETSASTAKGITSTEDAITYSSRAESTTTTTDYSVSGSTETQVDQDVKTSRTNETAKLQTQNPTTSVDDGLSAYATIVNRTSHTISPAQLDRDKVEALLTGLVEQYGADSDNYSGSSDDKSLNIEVNLDLRTTLKAVGQSGGSVESMRYDVTPWQSVKLNNVAVGEASVVSNADLAENASITLRIPLTDDFSGTVRVTYTNEDPVYKTVAGDNGGKYVEFNVSHFSEALIEQLPNVEANSWTTEPSVTGWIYGESGTINPGEPAHGEVAVTYTGRNGTDYNSSDVPTDAGDYTATFTVAETAEYAGLTKAVDFTIAQREVTLSWSNTALTYNGKAQNPTASIGNRVGTDDVRADVSGAQTSVGTDYTATVSGLSGTKAGNYKLPDSGLSTTFVIAAKALTITADSGSKVHDGTALTKNSYTSSGLAEGDYFDSVTVTGSQTEVGTSNNVPSAAVIKNAGGDNVTANYEITYANGTLTVSLEANSWTTEPSVTSWTYGESNTVNSGAAKYGTVAVTYTGISGTVYNSSTVPTNAGYYTATFTVAETTQYNGLTKTVNFTIAKREATLDWSLTELTYDGNPRKPVATVMNTVSGDSLSVSVTGAATAVGTYTATATGLSNGNYKLPSTGLTTTFSIAAKPLTITADSDTKMYDGTALTKDGYTSTALASSDRITSVTVTGSQTAFGTSGNVPSAAVIQNAKNEDVTANYAITYVNGTLEVTRKTLTITADSDTKVYDGTALTKNGYTSTELATGDTITSVSVTGSQMDAGSSDNTASAAVVKNAGGDDVTASYAITYAKGTLTVTKAPATVTTGSRSKAYDGTALTDSTASITGLVNSETATVTATGTITEVGSTSNTYSIEWGTAKAANYALTEVLGTLTITKADAAVTAPTAKTLTYTGSAQALVNAGSATGGTISYATTEDGAYTAAIPTGTTAGDYTVWYKVAGDGNHGDVAAQSVSVTIAKASVTVPTLASSTLAYTGTAQTPAVNGDVSKINVTNDSQTTVGSYNVTLALKDSDNYEWSDGTTADKTLPWSISAKDITVTVTGTDASRTYNGLNQSVAVAYTAESEDVLFDASKVTFTARNVSGKNAGDYNYGLNATEFGYGDSNLNVTFNVTDGKLTINPAELTITAKAKSITYGDAPANDGVTYAGFVTGEDASVLSGSLTYSYSYAQYGDVGSYTITPGGLTSGNYDLSFANGMLTVNPKALTITADAKSKTYGDADPALTYTASGLESGDSLTGALSRETGENVGTYAIKQGTLTAGDNYVISYTGANLTVSQATNSVTAPTAKTLTYTGSAQTLVNAGTATYGTMEYSLDGAAWATALPTATGVDTYTVSWRVTGTANYTGDSGSFTVSIAKASISPSVSITGWTVGGTANAPSVSGNPGSGAVTYAYKAQSADDSTYTATQPTTAGSYTVRATIAETANYLGGTATANFAITSGGTPTPGPSGPTGGTTTTIIDEQTPLADLPISVELVDFDPTLTVTAEIDEDERIVITVTDQNGNVVYGESVKVSVRGLRDGEVAIVRDKETGEQIDLVEKSLVEGQDIYAIVNGSCVLDIIWNAKPFTDVSEDSWYASAIRFVSSHELFAGFPDGSFRPDTPMDRAMLVTVLYRLENKPETALETLRYPLVRRGAQVGHGEQCDQRL